MSLFISSVFTYDEDAGNYIQAVEAADGQALEPATRKAINNFVLGCKADGIWTAIKASCILAGARTLTGALIPLAGTAPTNFNFVSGDYNRKTGLVGNGSTKYLDSNRNNNADPQDSNHNAAWVSTLGTGGIFGPTDSTGAGYNSLSNAAARNRNNSAFPVTAVAGFIGQSRSNGTSFIYRNNSSNQTASITSNTTTGGNMLINAFTSTGGTHRLAFYSIGESLNLALLDARVTDLINAFAVTIP